MTDFSDKEIQAIVQRVVQQSMGGETPSKSSDKDHLESNQSSKQVVAIGTDHGGVQLKETLKQNLIENNYDVIDVGTHSTDSVDYPDIALKVAELVISGQAWRGVIIDGAGIGSCMAANKVRGVRASLCYDYATAVNSRLHNNANVLTLGAGLIGTNLAKQILNTWLTTEFGGGRHARRVDKITAIEARYYKDGMKP